MASIKRYGRIKRPHSVPAWQWSVLAVILVADVVLLGVAISAGRL